MVSILQYVTFVYVKFKLNDIMKTNDFFKKYQGQIDEMKKEIINNNTRLQSNFQTRFEWGDCNTVYKCTFKLHRLEHLLDTLTNEGIHVPFKESVCKVIEQYTDELLSQSFIAGSTSSSHNDSHLYKCDVLREILKDLRWDVKYLK